MRDGGRDSRRDAAIIDWLVEQVAAVGAVGAVVALVSADAVALEPRWWVGYSEEVVDSWARIPIGSSTPLTDALRGDPVVVGSSWEQTTRYPVLGTRPTRGCAALAAVAVPGPSGRPVGALGLSFSTPHPRTTTPGVLLAAAQDLAALLGADDVVGPAPELAVSDEPARRAELARLGLGGGWGEVGELVHRLTALATRLLGVGRAQMSLLGAEQWVASTAGFTLPQGARGSPLSESLCSVTVASGGPLLIQDAPRHPWVRDLPPVRDGRVRRYVGVPLVSAAGTPIGALCAFDERTAPLPADAAATLGDLAAGIMTTLQLRTANEDLTATAEQLRQLQVLTARLSTAVTQDDIADVVVRHGIELIARHGVVGVLSADGTLLRTWPTAGFPADLVEDLRLLPLDAATPLTQAIRTGRPVLVPTLGQIRDRFPDTVDTHIATGTCAVLALPVRVGDEVMGALAFGFETEHGIDGARLTYAHTVADLTAQGLERARLYERQHRAAHQLQQALLPPTPLDLPGVQAAAAYRPADSDHDVGGDWYDVFALPGNRVGLVIGDVMGHDLHAAAAMGRVHAMLRAIAPTATGPADTLDRLDVAITSLPGLALTTIGYGDYDPTTGLLRYACAGHLPPLLVTHGHARYLPDGRSMPLGVPVGAREGTRPPRAEAALHVPPGSLLLWCTDGLVERRGEDIDTGLDTLAHLAEHVRGNDPHTHRDTIMSEMADGHHLHDDIALLCTRLDRTHDT